MRAIILMFDSLNRHMLSPYRDTWVDAPNFARLAAHATTFENFYAGSMPCMPARREMHTGRHNFLHRGWGPLEPFDDSMPQMLGEAGIHTHLASDHQHYWEDGGATYHTRYTTWEFFRGQEGDPWKGVVDGERAAMPQGPAMKRQDAVNRSYMPTEAEHSQTRTVDAGLHFLETNADADRWMLQLELFDPHEPFFTRGSYRDRYSSGFAAEGDAEAFDWPPYAKVAEDEGRVREARERYAALVSMCDHSLGRVLDAMDEHDMWDDTLLIVNTDHGFLLGERGWWAKSVQPWFNELVHLPMFMWDPRTGGGGDRRGDLARTIDIAPTVLGWFGLEPTEDMQGRDLGAAPEPSADRTALFGTHGGHVNVTDGRHVYMRAPADPSNSPLEEFTLMPTRMRSRVSVADLESWRPAEPFSFTKGLRTMRIPARSAWLNAWQHGTLLFDLDADPDQEHPIVDDAVETRMIELLVEAMQESDAPDAQYERLGVPRDGAVGPEHLRVRAEADRAAAVAEPLPPTDELPASRLLSTPVVELLEMPGMRGALEEAAPDLVATELVSSGAATTLLDLGRRARLPAGELRRVGAALASVESRA